jgi:Protein of unknown function (DUF1360)
VTSLAFVILALGAWRLWRILSTDEILDTPRDRLLGATQPVPGGPTHFKRKKLAEFVGCPWCFGFWIALGTFASWHWWSATNTVLIATPLALSAVIGLVTAHLD